MAAFDGQIFNTVDAMGVAIESGLADKMTKLAHHGDFANDFILIIFAFMLSAELIMCFITALSGSGQQAIQRGVESILIASFIFSITSEPVWRETIIPIVNGISKEAIKALGEDPDNIKSSLAKSIGESIDIVMFGVPASVRKGWVYKEAASGVPGAP